MYHIKFLIVFQLFIILCHGTVIFMGRVLCNIVKPVPSSRPSVQHGANLLCYVFTDLYFWSKEMYTHTFIVFGSPEAGSA